MPQKLAKPMPKPGGGDEKTNIMKPEEKKNFPYM